MSVMHQVLHATYFHAPRVRGYSRECVKVNGIAWAWSKFFPLPNALMPRCFVIRLFTSFDMYVRLRRSNAVDCVPNFRTIQTCIMCSKNNCTECTSK